MNDMNFAQERLILKKYVKNYNGLWNTCCVFVINLIQMNKLFYVPQNGFGSVRNSKP